jgi:hemolysin activation/secretion protein
VQKIYRIIPIIIAFIGLVTLEDSFFRPTLAQKSPFRILPEPREIPTPLKPSESPLDTEHLRPNIHKQDKFPTIQVKEFIYIGNTVLSKKDLDEVTSQYIGKKLSMLDINEIRDAITNLYVSKGYRNSAAQITGEDNKVLYPNAAKLTIHIIEGGLSEINIKGSNNIKKHAIGRLGVSTEKVLNVDQLLKHLQILQDDPSIKDISASLTPNINPINTATLNVKVKANKEYNLDLSTDNNSSPNSGTLREVLRFKTLNFFGYGEGFDLTQAHTAGSDAIKVSLSIPLKKDIKFTTSYTFGHISVIEIPFNIFDIQSTSQAVEIGLQSTPFHYIDKNRRAELGLGLTIKNQQNQDSLLGIPFQLTSGANSEGYLNTSLLTFSQSARYRDRHQAGYLNSQILLGINTNSKTDSLYNKGQFWGWRGYASYSHLLPWGIEANADIQAQFVSAPVVEPEKIALGGGNFLQGYSENLISTSNGVIGLLQINKSVFTNRSTNINVFGFAGIGRGWNGPKEDKLDQTIASAGIGIQARYKNISGNITYGIPLITIPGEEKQSLQGNGVTFSLKWSF